MIFISLAGSSIAISKGNEISQNDNKLHRDTYLGCSFYFLTINRYDKFTHQV